MWTTTGRIFRQQSTRKTLAKHMDNHGYCPVKCTNDLWKCKHNNVVFTLLVDDFGVKVNSEQEASHLTTDLQDKYETYVDYTGSLCVGVTLNETKMQ